MTTYYVTGVGGLVGSHMLEKLDKKPDAHVLGSYYTPTVDMTTIKVSDKSRIFCQDVRDHLLMKTVIGAEQPDVIFHFAAQSRPSESWVDPYYTVDVNVGGTIGLLEAVKAQKAVTPHYDPLIIVITSSAIYGKSLLSCSEDNLPDEGCPLAPLSPYGVSKAAQDLFCHQYYQNFGLRIIRVRLFNTTGPRKTGDITADFTKRAVMLERLHSNKLVVGNLSATRAILDVRDLCDALLVLEDKGKSGEAYNICSRHIFPMTDVIKAIEETIGTKYELVTDPSLMRPADESFYAGNCQKIENLGWVEKLTYADTVRDMINYWRERI